MRDVPQMIFLICFNEALQHPPSPWHGTKECCTSRVILLPLSMKADILHGGKERPRNN